MRNSSINKYLIPPPGYRFRPPWYTRPEFYVPITVAAFVIGGLAILVSMNLADLKNQAATFDLNKLEQMESASVILDRNNKIFGQIYVENRETIPYEQLDASLLLYIDGSLVSHPTTASAEIGEKLYRLIFDRIAERVLGKNAV